MNWNLSALEELKQCDLCVVADWLIECLVVHFHAGLSIVDDGVLDKADNLVLKIGVEECVGSLVLDDFTLNEELGDL